MDINSILLDLEIVKQIKENEKLAIHIVPGNSKLFVDNTVYFSSLKRWYNRYNREDSIKYLENLLVNINNISDLIISGSHNELSINLKNAIINALPGLDNLKNTYISDSISVAKIVLIINKLNKIIENLETIDILPNYKDMENVSLSMINNIEKQSEIDTNENNNQNNDQYNDQYNDEINNDNKKNKNKKNRND
jgi:hypothetical protein